MTEHIAESDVKAYFDRFVKAFATLDGGEVGAMFVTPGVALKEDNTLSGFARQSDIQAYYQAAIDRYAKQGCTACRYDTLSVAPFGLDAVLGTVTWDLIDDNGRVLTRWRQSYALKREGDGLKTFASAFVASEA